MKIGILGGGQLGKMIAQAARRLPFPVEIAIYDASPTACARTESDSFSVGSFHDAQSMLTFASGHDIVTYEFENIDPDIVTRMSNVPQGASALGILQNRLKEKEFINSLPGVQCVPYTLVEDQCPFDYPYIVKPISLGYDGKGQHVIADERDERYLKEGMVAEQYLSDVTEYSIIIARNIQGEIIGYPTFENSHVNQILDTTRFAQIDTIWEDAMRKKAISIAEALDYCGVLTVEFFFSNDRLYVNEVAPRVHNSGHVTLDAVQASQFDLHLFGLLGLPFPELEVDPSWCMVNVLGQHYRRVCDRDLPGHFYDYGKQSTKSNRKVGHINGRLCDLELLKRARIA